MKRLSISLFCLAVMTSQAYASLSQVIKCQNGNDHIEIFLEVKGSSIVFSEISYWGENLTPGLWKDQQLGSEAHIFVEESDSNLLGLVGGGTDPSRDDPYMFRISFPKNIVGKALKKGAFQLYLQTWDDGRYYATPEEIYAILKDRGELKNHPKNVSEAWGHHCWSYIEE